MSTPPWQKCQLCEVHVYPQLVGAELVAQPGEIPSIKPTLPAAVAVHVSEVIPFEPLQVEVPSDGFLEVNFSKIEMGPLNAFLLAVSTSYEIVLIDAEVPAGHPCGPVESSTTFKWSGGTTLFVPLTKAEQ